MSEVLVLVDHADGEVKKVTFELLTAARALGEPAAVVVGAPGTAAKLKDVAGRVRRREGLRRGVRRRRRLPGHPQGRRAGRAGEPTASPAAVLVAATAEGKEVSGRLAVRIGSGLLVDAVDLESTGGDVVVTQSIFGGAFVVKAKSTRGVPVVSRAARRRRG